VPRPGREAKIVKLWVFRFCHGLCFNSFLYLPNSFHVLSLEERTKESKVFKGNFCPSGNGQNRWHFFASCVSPSTRGAIPAQNAAIAAEDFPWLLRSPGLLLLLVIPNERSEEGPPSLWLRAC